MATATFNASQTQLAYTLNLSESFTDALTQAHIHVGSASGTGLVIFFLCATDPTIPDAAPPETQLCPDAVGGTIRQL
ncbi:MAG: CHRD domain-containing protein [Gammaproteobacteria bacterium]|nr:CHRD domain-containing protein [Gammaproteobacteria bacterium]